jgi:hypothetical protein
VLFFVFTGDGRVTLRTDESNLTRSQGMPPVAVSPAQSFAVTQASPRRTPPEPLHRRSNVLPTLVTAVEHNIIVELVRIEDLTAAATEGISAETPASLKPASQPEPTR